jgi:hypothetical protein
VVRHEGVLEQLPERLVEPFPELARTGPQVHCAWIPGSRESMPRNQSFV